MGKVEDVHEVYLDPRRHTKHRILLVMTKLLCLLSILTLGYLIYNHVAFEIRILQEERSAIQGQRLWDMTHSEMYHSKADILLDYSPPMPVRVVCYYTIARDNDSLQPEQVDAHLCTHIIVLNAGVVNGTIRPSTSGDVDVYRRMTRLKERNPGLKVMLCLGSGDSTTGLPDVITSEAKVRWFVSQSVKFLTLHNFDGLDIDWEFPSKKEHSGYNKLLEGLHDQFTQHSLILTAAVGAPMTIIDESYDIPGMAPHIDWVNVMCYDYHFYVSYYPLTGANSPLFPRHTQLGYFRTLNVAWSANRWVEKGMPREKVVVGVPVYGHSWHLLLKHLHGFSSPAIGMGSTGSGGFTSVVDACKFLGSGAKRVFNEESKVPYAYKGHEWISYEDDESATYKGGWIRQNNFGGIMIFDFSMDDYKPECPGVKAPFPIMRTLIKAYKGT